MDVIEHEHERRAGGDALEQLAHGPVGAVALVLQRRTGCGLLARHRREHQLELGAHLAVERAQAARLQARDELVERVDEDPERQVGLELRRAAAEHDVPARVGVGGELGEQARLADPGVAHQQRRRRPCPLQPLHRVFQRAELRGAPDEVLGHQGHLDDSGRA